ncbi:MAG: hypothetical protein QXX08_04770 [Candidatus Bathyarchaeia archaeon]
MKNSSFAILVITLSLIVITAYFLTVYLANLNSSNNTNNDSVDNFPRAALIDALYLNYPNDEFTKSVNETLQEAGFKVDIYKGQEVTVDSLKNLKSGYEVIIFRMHSALSKSSELHLFTAEPYSIFKYIQEQSLNVVKAAFAGGDPQPIFAVNYGFVNMFMKGKLNDTLVIVMGCDGTLDPQMRKAFMAQGARGYVGWNGPVLLSHSDDAVRYFLNVLYMEKISLEEAIDKTNNDVGKDPYHGTVLEYYSLEKS